jgi:vitamin B12 transporter
VCALAWPFHPVRADDGLVVTPNRMETPVEQVTGSVTVIGRAEIERRGWRTLPEALSEVPGLGVVQLGGPGGQTSLFTRGTESDHTLILVDGMEISDPANPGTVFDAAHLLTEGIERIEVLRGPQSTLYGSHALGGVVNVITRRGEGEPGASGWTEFGGMGSSQLGLRTYGTSEGTRWSLGYGQLHTRGISARDEELGGSERDGYDNRSLDGRFDVDLDDGLGLQFSGRLIDSELELDAFADDESYLADTRQLLLRAEGHAALADGLWHPRLAISLADHDRQDHNRADPISSEVARSSFDGRRTKLEWLNDLYFTRDQVLTLGAESERESMQSRDDYASAGFTSNSRVHDAARTNALFAHHQLLFGDRIVATLGVRADDHEEFGSALTYRAGAAYALPRTNTRLRASLGTGFKAPSLTDLYGNSSLDFGGFPSRFLGNPELDPERSRGWEIGIEQPLAGDRLRLGTAYFSNRIRDLIEFAFLPSGDSTLQNVSSARTHGFESFAAFALAPRLSLRIDHTALVAEDDDGEDLKRRPGHQLSARLELSPLDRVTLSLGARYVGEREDFDFNTGADRTLDDYTVAGIAASWEPRKGLRIFGRIDNLFDRDYDDPHGYESRPFTGYVGVSTGF